MAPAQLARLAAFVGGVAVAALAPQIASAWQCQYTEPFVVVARQKPIVAHVRVVSHLSTFAGVTTAEIPWKPGSAQVLRTFKGELPSEITLLNAPAPDTEWVMALEAVDRPMVYRPLQGPGEPFGEGTRSLMPPDHTYSYGMTILSCEELLLPVRDGFVEGHVYFGFLNRARRFFGLWPRGQPYRLVSLADLESLVAP